MTATIETQRPARKLRPADAAQKLGISLPTLYRWERNRPGFPQRIKLSQRVSVYDDGELEAFVASARGS